MHRILNTAISNMNTDHAESNRHCLFMFVLYRNVVESVKSVVSSTRQ